MSNKGGESWWIDLHGTCELELGALCFYSSPVLVDSFVLLNPPERKARKRWQK